MKRSLKTIYLLLLGILLSFTSTVFTLQPESSTIERISPVTQWAQEHLPQTGTLREGRDGYVYLKVDDRYIYELFPMLSAPEYTKPSFFRRKDSPGAHISVFYVGERNQTGKIKEIGQKYSFEISDLAWVPPKTHQYIVLEVSSPELEQLRTKYGLSPLLKGHQFHITIAKKKT